MTTRILLGLASIAGLIGYSIWNLIIATMMSAVRSPQPSDALLLFPYVYLIFYLLSCFNLLNQRWLLMIGIPMHILGAAFLFRLYEPKPDNMPNYSFNLWITFYVALAFFWILRVLNVKKIQINQESESDR